MRKRRKRVEEKMHLWREWARKRRRSLLIHMAKQAATRRPTTRLDERVMKTIRRDEGRDCGKVKKTSRGERGKSHRLRGECRRHRKAQKVVEEKEVEEVAAKNT